MILAFLRIIEVPILVSYSSFLCRVPDTVNYQCNWHNITILCRIEIILFLTKDTTTARVSNSIAKYIIIS